jgi:sortase (surface protein transpeptidase)
MDKVAFVKLLEKAYRQYARVLAFALFGVCVGATLTHLFLISQKPVEKYDEPVASEELYLSRSVPATLTIPKLNLTASFEEPLGLYEDKTVEVPESYEKVGWYQYGATPGERGSAVVLGHVDSVKGPAVFYSLPRLEVGDRIEVVREDSLKAVFVVEDMKRYAQDTFPSELVYGKTEKPTLRLVTCTGTFDKGAQRYSHNYVVFATYQGVE